MRPRPFVPASLSVLVAASIALAGCASDTPDPAPESTASVPATAAPVPAAPIDTTSSTAATDSLRPRTRYRAVGQEPGWLLTIEDTLLTLRWDYDENRLTTRAPESRPIAGGRQWTVPDVNVPVTVIARDTACADAMSGRPYPARVTVRVAGRTLDGCGGDPTRMIFGDEWKVDSLNGAPLAAGSSASITFGDDGRAFGLASCNNFTATFELRGDSATFQPAIVTRRACASPAHTAQETALLRAIEGTVAVRIDATGRLHLTGAGGQLSAVRK